MLRNYADFHNFLAPTSPGLPLVTVVAPGNSYLANTSYYELIQAFSNLEVFALLLRAVTSSYYELLRAITSSYYELLRANTTPPKLY